MRRVYGPLFKVTGWYDSVFDEELGSQPCIFTSVTPVSAMFGAFSPLCDYDLSGLEQCKLDAIGRENQVPSRVVWFVIALFRCWFFTITQWSCSRHDGRVFVFGQLPPVRAREINGLTFFPS